VPISAKTLSGKATRGGGPPYGLFAGRALYRWGAALDWARSRLQARQAGRAASYFRSDQNTGIDDGMTFCRLAR
jgi:hypothetical protein